MLRHSLPAFCFFFAVTLQTASAQEPVRVAAASSLTDVMPRIAIAWREAGGTDVVFAFDASSRLARQISEGAPADIFVSADADWMDFLEQKGRLEADTRGTIVSNTLVVVVPRSALQLPASVVDLGASRFKCIALAAENVPAGRYARAALRSSSALDSIAGRIVSSANVRAALQLAARGEVDAAIVYRTDALVEPRVQLAFAFDPLLYPRPIYPAAVVRGCSNAAAARRFLSFCRSPQARQIFRDAGFDVEGS